MKRQCVLLTELLWLIVAAAPVLADVQLNGMFGDNMVLQRGKALPVWGTAEAGEDVTVTIGTQSLATKANDQGQWSVRLQPIDKYGPVTFSVTGHNTIALNNVVVGEVWLCSGQSNMAWPVNRAANGVEEIAAAVLPEIRLFTVPRNPQPEPQNEIKGSWAAASPETVPNFSAVAWFFGRELHRELQAPIGLVNSSVGGTAAELWTPADALKGTPTLEAAAKTPKAYTLYNGMIAPLVPFAIAGVIWYQGEANGGRGEAYKEVFPTLIRSWRSAWGQGDFPFLYVQLANYGKRQETPADAPWARLREAQLYTLKEPATAMAVTIDIGEGGNIHPTNKQEVGRRLSLAALSHAYGKKLTFAGPLFDAMTIANGSARLTFKNAEGLKTTDGGALKGFAIAGEDRKWVWATATIDKDAINVASPDVPNPVAVRYAWGSDPEVNLVNGAGLPTSPFRTDDWEVAR